MLHSHPALHIPDGFLSPLVLAVGWLLAVPMLAVALRQTRSQLGERQIPMMGILAAFVFAAQAINFPVAAGTSGHLMGGALAAIIMALGRGVISQVVLGGPLNEAALQVLVEILLKEVP